MRSRTPELGARIVSLQKTLDFNQDEETTSIKTTNIN